MMYDEDLLEAIRDTMPRQRPEGFGVTAPELCESSEALTTERMAVYYLEKQVKAGDLQKERMYDFDGTKRSVYYKNSTSTKGDTA